MLRLWQRQTTQVQTLGNRALAHEKRISRPYRMPIGYATDATDPGFNRTKGERATASSNNQRCQVHHGCTTAIFSPYWRYSTNTQVPPKIRL
ncbi:hypothetical protein EMIT0324P_21188 [Pseudomonas chlororaphis]